VKLSTPVKIRELQRKLYLKAKQEKSYRFYSLYDKVYRLDILHHAYRLVRARDKAPGVDGLTFAQIEESQEGIEGFLLRLQEELKGRLYRPDPVRRVYIPKPEGEKRPLGIPTIRDRVVQMATKLVIEPIFEADFQENSYGFRPKRNAHQAVEDVSKQLLWERTKVIDADLSKYFDTIPHKELLNLVAQRIVDGHILRLIKMWLKAPVIVKREDGKKVYEGGKGSKRGTPQGGVISPLLANIYLNVLDSTWKERKVEERLSARLIRYADDFVVLCKWKTAPVLKEVNTVLSKLDLALSREKTRVVDAREESFDFLGFNIRISYGRKSGKLFPLIRPSKKAVKKVRREIKQRTARSRLALPTGQVIKDLNKAVQGWVGYFYFENCSRDLNQVKRCLEERVRTYLRRKHRKRTRCYKIYPNSYLYQVLGLYKVPTTAPWTQALAKA